LKEGIRISKLKTTKLPAKGIPQMEFSHILARVTIDRLRLHIPQGDCRRTYAPFAENLERITRVKSERIEDLLVVILD
jgi:hypothetical protein